MKYGTLKKIAFALLPRRILLNLEPLLRRMVLFRFRGSVYHCNLCDNGLKKFVVLDDHDLLCPFCGSRSRTRALFKLMEDKKLLQGEVLHFSPPRVLCRKLKKNPDISYISTDFSGEFRADRKFDIKRIDLDDHSVDLIICFHILEHIDEDRKAIHELARVLKPNGTCIIQTPFKQGQIYEDPSITGAAARLKAFGQNDHVRIYSLDGLRERLLRHGFGAVNVVSMENTRLGIPRQRILLTQKTG